WKGCPARRVRQCNRYCISSIILAWHLNAYEVMGQHRDHLALGSVAIARYSQLDLRRRVLKHSQRGLGSGQYKHAAGFAHAHRRADVAAKEQPLNRQLRWAVLLDQ